MAKEEKIKLKGIISKALGNAMFRIDLDSGEEVLGYISGKMRQGKIRVLVGDSVDIEFSRYDPTRGRIIYRNK